MNAAGSVAPNIFDVRADPEILHALIIANSMSPRLWSLAERMRGLEPAPDDPLPAHVRGAQRVLDRYFTHLTPAQVLEIDGVLDLDAEATRLGEDVVERAIAGIEATFRWRVARGYSLADDPAVTMIAERRFPAYTYGELDTLHAYRKQLGRRSSRPIGLTSCLDEAALFAALQMITPADDRRGVVVLTHPAHFTVFGWNGDATWWFYGKNRLHAAAEHAALIDDAFAGDAALAFDDVMAEFDRVITRRGTFDFTTGESSIPRDELDELAERMRTFFQVLPAQFERALAGDMHHVEPSAFDALIADCVGAGSCEEVHAVVRAAAVSAGPVRDAARAVLAAHRSLRVTNPSVYLPAAREGAHLRAARPGIVSVEDALSLVRAIEGRESMFGDPDRIAMPEEVLVLNTGTDRDRALLLHVLLEPLADGPVTTVMTADGTVVISSLGAFGGPEFERIPISALPGDLPDTGGLMVR